MKTYNVLAITFLFLSACQQVDNGNKAAATNSKPESVKTEVLKMSNNIAHDLSVGGPEQWLNYFEQTPGFFMANEGQLAFANNDSATHFVKEVLAKNIMKVNLTWSNIRVDSLSPTLAVMAAHFHESLIDKANNTIPADGYFTGTVEKTADGWKLRNLHWSTYRAKD